MKKIIPLSIFLGLCLVGTFLKWPLTKTPVPLATSGAGAAMDAWAAERLYPSNQLPTQEFYKAFDNRKQTAVSRNVLPKWDAIGPKNIAGRTLALAFHPTNKNIIYLGSASGGLWKTETMGLGATAWERVATGFPILGVAAIAINPQNPNQIFIGTGEVYNNNAAEPGIIDRLTRGSYGIGILKTEDGGQTWSKSLDWSYQNFTGIQHLVFHPTNLNILYAATTEGLLKTVNGGSTWTNIHEVPMAVDIVISPHDPSTIFVSHGSYFNQNSGIYRSKDDGANFELLKNGLPYGYTGKAMLALNPNAPNEIYAAVASAFATIGLFRTRNSGDDWDLQNDENVAKYQGWYSHDIVVNPFKPNELVYVGIDSWHSTDSGANFVMKGNFEGKPTGKTPIEGPDGPPNYVHSDIHRAYFHPLLVNRVFLATDGGVFVSEDGGLTFGSRNGGLQTSQFYANFSNSATDSLLAIGGMQDNWTAIYDGTGAWTRQVGGDGMTTAINSVDDHIMYASTQYGGLFRSEDRGKTFEGIDKKIFYTIGNNRYNYSGRINFNLFNPPLELAPSSPNIMYTANTDILRSSDRGTTWDFNYNGNRGEDILTIGVSPHDTDYILYGTVPSLYHQAKVFSSQDGGKTATLLNGLPNLIVKDFAFHPDEEQIMYAVFSGYGEAHFWRTLDGGTTWEAPATNLPDLPHHSILVDPLFPDHIYVGTDLGVYFSEDGGITWAAMMNGLPEAIYAINLSYSPSNRKIRVATHGSGVYEAPMVFDAIDFSVSTSDFLIEDAFNIVPNPVDNLVTIEIELNKKANITVALYDSKGQYLQTLYQQQKATGNISFTENISFLSEGLYFVNVYVEGVRGEQRTVKAMKLVKL